MVEKINASHTLISENTIYDLVKHEIPEEVRGVRFLTRGLNDTYKVEGKNSNYAYRVYRHGWRGSLQLVLN